MAQMRRPGLSASQKAELWLKMEGWAALSDIGRSLGEHAESVHGVVSSNGGIVPPNRRRSRLELTLLEREEISRNQRPRKTLAFYTPADKLEASVATTC
jgi:hypothetical protein